MCSGPPRAGWRRVPGDLRFRLQPTDFSAIKYAFAPPAPPMMPILERVGVCRDFAHLAVAFCRCMNIPARYANGFRRHRRAAGDLEAPMDYNAWFEVFLDGRWFTFDARHNMPRIGRITVSRKAGTRPIFRSLPPLGHHHFEEPSRSGRKRVEPDVLASLTRRIASHN